MELIGSHCHRDSGLLQIVQKFRDAVIGNSFIVDMKPVIFHEFIAHPLHLRLGHGRRKGKLDKPSDPAAGEPLVIVKPVRRITVGFHHMVARGGQIAYGVQESPVKIENNKIRNHPDAV